MSAVDLTIASNGVATLTIDHPPINLMTTQVFVELAKSVARCADDDAVRAVIVRSASADFFIAHFDVEAIQQMPVDQPAPTTLNNFHRLCETLRTMPKPTIAVIEGRVGGGGNELAMSCDMRFATPDAVFNQPEVALGIIPGGSGTVRLPRLVGRGRALEMILGCDDIDAETADAWGMVNRVIDTANIAQFVERLTARIVSYPPDAVAAAKASVLGSESGVEGHLLAEGTAFNALLGSPETVAAMQSFLDAGGQTVEAELDLGAMFDPR